MNRNRQNLSSRISKRKVSLEREVGGFALHYNRERNRQSLENKITRPEFPGFPVEDDLRCRKRPGGLLRYHYPEADCKRGMRVFISFLHDQRHILKGQGRAALPPTNSWQTPDTALDPSSAAGYCGEWTCRLSEWSFSSSRVNV